MHTSIKADAVYFEKANSKNLPSGVVVSDLMYSLGNFLQLVHHLEGAEQMYHKAIDLYTRASQLLSVADAKCKIARLWKVDREKDQEADDLLKQAMTIYEREKGTNATELVNIINQRATLCISNQKYKEAEEILLRALRIGEVQLGLNHFSIGITFIIWGVSIWDYMILTNQKKIYNNH